MVVLTRPQRMLSFVYSNRVLLIILQWPLPPLYPIPRTLRTVLLPTYHPTSPPASSRDHISTGAPDRSHVALQQATRPSTAVQSFNKGCKLFGIKKNANETRRGPWSDHRRVSAPRILW